MEIFAYVWPFTVQIPGMCIFLPPNAISLPHQVQVAAAPRYNYYFTQDLWRRRGERDGPAGCNDRWSPRWSPAGLDGAASCGTLRGHLPPWTNGAFRVSDLLQHINDRPQGTHTLAVMPPLRLHVAVHASPRRRVSCPPMWSDFALSSFLVSALTGNFAMKTILPDSIF